MPTESGFETFGSVLVIRRKVTREQSYTVLMLPGYHKEWPTTEREHLEILKVFKQDRRYQDVVNDFIDYNLDDLFSD